MPHHNMDQQPQQWFEPILASGLVPDLVLRTAARASIRRGLRRWHARSSAQQARAKKAVLRRLDRSPIAIKPEQANQQHYEVPSEFFQLVLGPRLKYSCCYWPEGTETLAGAEEAMLKLTCQRAELQDGMRLLDLGCGWGSLSLWLAVSYPHSQITALSNSATQQEFIRSCAQDLGVNNLSVMRANVAEVKMEGMFDRVLSIEMFEHMRNYRRLLGKISGWLAPKGKLFVHHFSHRQHLYTFEVNDRSDFMARTYFAGGTMPSHDLLFHFEDDFKVEQDWRLNGQHYTKTLRAWLEALDANRNEALDIFTDIDGPRTARQWLTYWRNFFMLCEETFAVGDGEEFIVSHLLLSKLQE